MKSWVIIKLFSTLILVFLSSRAFSQGEPGWQPSQETLERLTKNQSEFNYFEEKVPAYKLPEVLVSLEGKKVNDVQMWEESRRNEILELFRTNVYGRVPSTEYTKSFKLINEDKNAMGGDATLRQVDITIESNGNSLDIHLTLFIPNKVAKPVPAFLLIDNRGPQNTDPERKVKSEFWPAEEVIARGYAIAVFSNADVDPDNFDDFKNGIHGLLDRGERKPDSWGTIAAWAWGASRCMDYFETDKDINIKKVAVVGHSRGGKTALWAAAEDKRFAMAVSNESGCGGAALARRKYGETISRINSAFPHWFCLNYRKWSDNEDSMPVDMHMLIALIAPRAVYVTSASEDLWADPRGSYLSLYYSIPVFQFYDRNSILPDKMPPLNRQVIGVRLAYHIRDGAHNMLLKDWNWFMDFGVTILK